MAEKAELDEDLAGGLKQAKSRRMLFVLVMKGGADGALIVSKMKVPPAAIADAKKRCGGSSALKGACFVEDGKYVFELAKEPPATMPQAVKLIAKRDAGLTINAICRRGDSPDLIDESDQPAAQAATAPQPQASPAVQGASAAKKGFSPVEFAKWRLNWEAARKKVLGDMLALHKAISSEFKEDEDLGKALAQAVNELLEQLNSDLDDALNAIINGKDDAARETARANAVGVIGGFKSKLASEPLVKQVEVNKFMPLSIQAPVSAALKALEGSLKG
jgi:hypothetical protein